MPFEIDHDFDNFVYIKMLNRDDLGEHHAWTLKVPNQELVEMLLEKLAEHGEPADDRLAFLHAVWPDHQREITSLLLEQAFVREDR